MEKGGKNFQFTPSAHLGNHGGIPTDAECMHIAVPWKIGIRLVANTINLWNRGGWTFNDQR